MDLVSISVEKGVDQRTCGLIQYWYWILLWELLKYERLQPLKTLSFNSLDIAYIFIHLSIHLSIHLWCFHLKMVFRTLCKSVCNLSSLNMLGVPLLPIVALVTFGRVLPVDKLLEMTQRATTLATTTSKVLNRITVQNLMGRKLFSLFSRHISTHHQFVLLRFWNHGKPTLQTSRLQVLDLG